MQHVLNEGSAVGWTPGQDAGAVGPGGAMPWTPPPAFAGSGISPALPASATTQGSIAAAPAPPAAAPGAAMATGVATILAKMDALISAISMNLDSWKRCCVEAVRQITGVFGSRRVSPVALVPPVVVASPVVAVLAVLRVVAVSPVLAMRWFSFVHEGFSSQWNQTGYADSEHRGPGKSRRNRVAKVGA